VARRDFTRACILSPELVVTLLLYMVGDANRRGYRHVLDAFWDECASHRIPLPCEEPVTGSAFCQARYKISNEMLRELLHDAAAIFEETYPERSQWRDRRVFAIDGSKFNLGRSDELDSHFGRPKNAYCPQATVSALVNVSSGLPCDVRIAAYAASERALLLEHLEVIREGDVVVLDRGYPSHEIMQTLIARGIDFLIRVPESYAAVGWIRETKHGDYRVMLEPPTSAPRNAEDIEVRVVRITNPAGENLYFMTSLRRAHFSPEEIRDLYRKRWEAEELYKLEKASYFDQHQFHARQPHGVKQEILAQALFVVIARFLMATAADAVGADYRDLSPKSAVLGLADYITRICLTAPQGASRWLPRLLARIARTRDKNRPNRSFPRRSFRPRPRWGPRGRQGA